MRRRRADASFQENLEAAKAYYEVHCTLCAPRTATALESAQERWRAITGAHLVALVRAGARFENGVLVERQDQAA